MILNPISLVLPNVTTAERLALDADLGAIVYDTGVNKPYVCVVSHTPVDGSWTALF